MKYLLLLITTCIQLRISFYNQGAFEIFVDGQKIFSKLERHGYPVMADVCITISNYPGLKASYGYPEAFDSRECWEQYAAHKNY